MKYLQGLLFHRLCPATIPMLGRVTASNIASAPLKSFLLPFPYGFTRRGLINFTTCPSFINSLAP